MEDEKRYNEIDMECNVDPDDDGFGSNFISKETVESDNSVTGTDGRELQKHTGIILNFGDDEEVKIEPTDIEVIEQKPIVVQSAEDLFNQKLDSEEVNIPKEFTGYNVIDMECEVPDDYEEEKPLTNSGAYLDFGDEAEQDEIDRQLVNEQIVEESKRQARAQIDQGDVEDDYYDKLQKKHAASNKKGAYNYHFHFSGNPKAEAEMFNHDMTPNGPVPNMVTATETACAEASAMGESLNPSYRKLFEDLLLITGCELGDCKDGKCCIKDIYGGAEDKVCTTINDIQDFLNPYVEDCFIIPLQIETGNNFKTCKEWSDWYTPEMQKAYPQCQQDIKYCDLCANHLPECKLF